MKVLVVDPTGGVQSPLEGVLAARGHAVCRSASAEAALEACRERVFDLVVLDRCRDEAEALAFSRALRGSPAGGHCALLVVGLGDAAEVERTLAAGADDVIPAGEPADRLAVRLAVVEHQAERLSAGRRIGTAVLAAGGNYREVPASAPDRDLVVELERKMLQAQKMEELGKLAGGIAHDFNNLLMVIQGTAELLQRRRADDEVVQRQVGVILHTSRSAADLTRALLDFARQQVLEMTDLDLGDLVDTMVPLLQRVLPENISLEHRRGPSLGNVRADRVRLEQVLMNLCVNSRDAMPNGGPIVITTGNVMIGQEFVRSRPWASTGPHVELGVTDSGCGMDAATLAQVFKPFFTTKKAGKGTGLGMASVYGIVKQHGGMVDIVSAPGAGTTVRVLLPMVERRSAATAPATAPGVGIAGSETLLVVEDDEELRRMLADYLQGLGYRVLTARDGVEALEVLRGGDEKVQLVITDLSMPRMGGCELYRRARELEPRLGFLFCTGHGQEWGTMAGCEDDLTSRVDKPCAVDLLVQKARELLLRARAPAGSGQTP